LELPNKPLTSRNCNACWLNFTTSPGAAFFNADCTAGEDRTEEIDAEPVLDSSWDKSVKPGFVVVTALIKVRIGRFGKSSNYFLSARNDRM
jgi:hypothetical protein